MPARVRTFHPGGSEDDQKVGELAQSEQRAAEYQAERPADITHQSEHRVRRFSLDVRVRQLREKYLHGNNSIKVLSHQTVICAK